MPTKTSGPNSGLGLMAWETFVSDSTMDLTGGLFAWPFSVAVAGLRWGDLINTAPATAVLMKKGPIGFAEKTKTRGVV